MVRFGIPHDWLSLGHQNPDDTDSSNDSSSIDDIPNLVPRAPSPEMNRSNLPPEAAPDGILPRSNPKLNQDWQDFYSKTLNPDISTNANAPHPQLRRSMQPSLCHSKKRTRWKHLHSRIRRPQMLEHQCKYCPTLE